MYNHLYNILGEYLRTFRLTKEKVNNKVTSIYWGDSKFSLYGFFYISSDTAEYEPIILNSQEHLANETNVSDLYISLCNTWKYRPLSVIEYTKPQVANLIAKNLCYLELKTGYLIPRNYAFNFSKPESTLYPDYVIYYPELRGLSTAADRVKLITGRS